jgi:hypothetical protein
MGDVGWQYLTTDLLHQPVSARAEAARNQVTEGNYLAFAVVAGWIRSITYVAPSCRFAEDGVYRRDDRIARYFVGDNPESGTLSLPLHPQGSGAEVINREPLRRDTPVSFRTINALDFTASSRFDSAFLARSPRYTPIEADQLHPVVRRYLALIEYVANVAAAI